MNNWLHCTNQTLCAHCYNNIVCDTLRCAIKTGTRITNCQSFIDEDKDAHLRIAENPELMKLIYDYFLDRVDEKVLEKYSYDEIKDIITRTLTGI